jgi:hypothetical protein
MCFPQFPESGALWALTYVRQAGSIAAERPTGMERDIEDKSYFISSCSRRELARRRPHRSLPPLPVAAIALVLLMAAIGLALSLQGTL